MQAQAKLWLGDPSPTAHLGSVLEACQPSLPPAAAAMTAVARANPGYAATAEAYRTRHHADLDPSPAMTRQMQVEGERLGTHVLSGGHGDYKVKLSFTFDADGALKPPG